MVITRWLRLPGFLLTNNKSYMEKTIAIQEINQEVKDFLAMPQSVAKNILYHRQFQGNHFPCGNILIRENFNIVSMDYNLFDREKGFVLEQSGSYPDKYSMLVEI